MQAIASKWPTILIAGTLAEFGLFFGMWLMFDSARMAAGVMVAGHVVASLICIGAWLSFRATSSTVEKLAASLQLQAPAPAARQEPDEQPVEGEYRQLPPPLRYSQALLPPVDLQRIGNDEFVRRDQIERTAVKIYCRLYPHTPPTRQNIEAAIPGMTSHGFITACMVALKDRGVADSAGQGGAWRWIVKEETPSLPARQSP